MWPIQHCNALGFAGYLCYRALHLDWLKALDPGPCLEAVATRVSVAISRLPDRSDGDLVEKEGASSALPVPIPLIDLLRSLMLPPTLVDYRQTDSVAAEKLNNAIAAWPAIASCPAHCPFTTAL